ncbi:MAG TPA: F0F1 ATP synthase subunit delta [Bacillota bacterium]|nr:F0F1 ATP synthase subunit delta [Bacillota bacterium]
MSEAIVAKRYAEALFQIGDEKSTLNELLEQFQIVNDVFAANEQLYPFLEHPRMSADKKKSLLKETFTDLSADVLNTLQLLIDRHRITIIPQLVEHLNTMVNEKNEVAEATVTSVRALSEQELNALEENFKKRFNKQAIKIENKVDPSVIGGLRIRIGNTIYDGSVSGKLKRIERNMTKVNN